MRALRDMNMPKFVFEDVPLFLGLISDLFPGLDCPRVRYPNFNDAVEEILVKNKNILLEHQVSFKIPFLKSGFPASGKNISFWKVREFQYFFVESQGKSLNFDLA